MTTKELSQLYHLNREIAQDKRRLAQLEGIATDTSVNISGLPHVSGISNKTALACDISDIKAAIQAKVQLSVIEYNRLNRYIASIDDSLVRQIVTLRFVDGLKWRDVAQRIGGGCNSESIRKALYRYLSKVVPQCPK